MSRPWTIAFHAPIKDMDGFTPLGGAKGSKDAMLALFNALAAAPQDRLDIAGMDLIEPEGQEVDTKDVLLEDAARILETDVPVMLSRGRQALAEINDAAASGPYTIDDFGRVV